MVGQLGDLSPEGSIAVSLPPPPQQLSNTPSSLPPLSPANTSLTLSPLQIGILVGLISTSVQSLGLTLQRKSHILEDEKAPHVTRRPPHRRRRWQLGMAMFIISNLLGSTIQITTLPLPVLSTLQASGLVFNSICATLILGEPFTRWSLGGTCLVCAGALLIAIFGAIPEPAHNLDQLLALLYRPPFILWMLGQAALVATITAVAASLARHSSPRIRLLRGLAFGSISGILSAHSLLFAKISVELLVRTIIDHKNQFDRYQSSLILATLVALALVQLYYLHHGLKLVSTSVLYPLVFCIYNIIAILDGLIYFHQTSLLTPLAASLIALGTVILLSGVLALSWRLSDEQSPPPPPSALTPGLGLVDDDTDSPLPTPGTPDEESALLPNHNHSHASLLTPSSPLSPQTPATAATAKLDSVLSLTRSVRTAETAAIWEELQDRDGATRHSLDYGTVEGGGDENTPLSGRRRRRRSTGFRGFVARDSPRQLAGRGVLGQLFGRWGRRRASSTVEEEEEGGTW
ncbi:hypothetical protein VE03_02939 [Pseudogymnoascus sp. 23342-1-I1]|nr:hypothetical protein VE03_02939 [Pseudogymnoascus sp. 23342-1-I1]